MRAEGRGDKHAERAYAAECQRVSLLLRGFHKSTLGKVGPKPEQQIDSGLRTNTASKSWADIYQLMWI